MDLIVKENIKNQLTVKETIILFQADWCAPCKIIKPFFIKKRKEFEEYANFKIVNIDQNDSHAIYHKIKSIPTILILKNEKEIKRIGFSTDITMVFTTFLNNLFKKDDMNISAN